MPDSHEEFRENDIKEMQRKRQRSEPHVPSTGGWQITSNSRCIVCRRLQSLCDCKSSRMDPQLKRQKLDTLLLNTPYVRCKQLRAMDEVGRLECRQRRLLVEQWGDELQTLKRTLEFGLRLILLNNEETTGRESLTTLQRKEWLQGIRMVEHCLSLHVVIRNEREGRMQLCTTAQRATQVLYAWHSARFQLLSLESRETTYRGALVSDEAAERTGIMNLEIDLLGIMENNEKERHALFEEFWAVRDFIYSEWYSGVDAIGRAAEEDQFHISHMMQELRRLCELCTTEKKGTERLEEEARQRLHVAAVRDRNRVIERGQLFEQQRLSVIQEESVARCAVVQQLENTYNSLCCSREQGIEEVRELVALKQSEREGFLRNATLVLQSIMKEEEEIRGGLKVRERHECDLRHQWILEKERAVQAAELNALRQLQQLCDEEKTMRSVLMQRKQQEEVEVTVWLQHRDRRLGELVGVALEQKVEIEAVERNERFSLVSRKAENEDAVRRWVDQKESVRQSFLLDENAHRRYLCDAECAEWDEMAWRFGEGLEFCRSLLQERAEAQVRFQQRAFQCMEDLAKQESAALLLLQSALRDDRERALREENYRKTLDLLKEETEHRSHLLQQETRHREGVSTQKQLEESFFVKAVQESFKAQECEILESERGQRCVLEHLNTDAWNTLLSDFKKGYEVARRVEEERRREEMRRREIELVEDARLYREEEEELTDSCYVSRDAVFSDVLKCPLVSSERGVIGESNILQKQFITSELGAGSSDVAQLSPSVVGFIVGVLDAVCAREAQLTTGLQKAETIVGEVCSKLEKQKKLLTSAKEQLEESRAKLSRDAADHKTRVELQRKAQLDLESQLTRERQRLKKKTEELNKMRDIVSDMRDNIHSSYKKR
ncbi:hypothetical protein ERJ75_001188400 [Trypanosoma vivax]|nr:hypothetical protein ERJ75_001188400 [Trypanosoma vivax]